MIKAGRRQFIRLASAVAASGLAMPLVARSALGAPKHMLKLVYPDTPAHPFMQVALRFAENVARKTDGAVEVQVFTTGQLGSQMNMMTSLQTGIVDLCAHTTGFVQTIFPRIMVLDLPFLFPDSSTAERVLDSPTGQTMLTDLTSKGVYGLSYGHFGWRVVSTVDREVVQPEAMKGLKIRVQPGAIFVAMFKELQATPLSVDLSEVYLALSQRAIEGIETPMISVAASKHYEVVKEINLTNHVYNPGVMMASKRKMDGLSPAYQEAIRQASHEMTPDWRKTIAEASTAAEADFKAKELDVIEVDRAAYRKAVEPVYRQFRETITPGLMDSVLGQVS